MLDILLNYFLYPSAIIGGTYYIMSKTGLYPDLHDVITPYIMSSFLSIAVVYDDYVSPIIVDITNYLAKDMVFIGENVFIKRYIGNSIYYVDILNNTSQPNPRNMYMSFEVKSVKHNVVYEIMPYLSYFLVEGNRINDNHIVDILKQFYGVNNIESNDLSYIYINNTFDVEKTDTFNITVE